MEFFNLDERKITQMIHTSLIKTQVAKSSRQLILHVFIRQWVSSFNIQIKPPLARFIEKGERRTGLK